MANIQGITISIGGETSGLTQALRTVDRQAKGTQDELRAIERGLKFNPSDTTLLAQQQQLLADSIENASTRLDALRNAQERVQQQFESGDIGVEQYRLFQREIANSESSLRNLEGRLQSTESTQTRFNDAQRQLTTYLEATGQSVDDLASTLGSRLTNSIRDGSASADQLEAAIRRISQTSGNTIQDLERFQDVLRNSGNNNLDDVRRDLEQISDAAEEAERDVSGLSGSLGGLVAGAGAAVGATAVTGLVEELTEANIAFTQLQVQANTFGVDLENLESGRNALSSINADVKQISETFGTLLKAGFDNEAAINNISEALAGASILYGETFNPEGLAESIGITTQLSEATGQFADLIERSGVDVDTFNASLAELNTVQERANFIAKLLAEEGLNDAFNEYAKLNPEIQANSASVSDNTQALAELATSLTNLVVQIRDFVTSIVEWVNANEGLATTLVVVTTGIGLLVAAFALLFPAIGGLVTALPLITSLFAGIGAPILIVISAIVALGAAFVTLYTQSEEFRNGVNQVFNEIRDVALQVFETIADFIGEQIQKIRDFWATDGQQVLEAAQNVFSGIQAVVEFVMPAILAVVEFVWDSIKIVIEGALDVILGIVKVFAGVFTGDFDKVWEGVKQIFSGGIELILGILNLSFVGGIRRAVVSLAKTFIDGIKKLITDVVTNFNNLKTRILGSFGGFSLNQIGKDLIAGLVKGISGSLKIVTDAVKNVAKAAIQQFKDTFGIRSPAREGIEIGGFFGQGVAIGVEGTKALNEKAVNDVAKVIMDATERNAKAIQDIDNKNEAERDKLRKAANDKIIKLQRDLSTSIGKVQADGTAKNAKAEKANDDKRANLRSANAVKISDIEKKLSEDLITTNDKYYKQIVEQEAKLNAERLKSVEDYIAARKANDDLSLIDEAEYLRASYQQFATGSAENLKLQSAYRDSVKSINDAITRVNDDNLKETQRINSDLIKAEEDLNKNYEDTLNNRYNTLVNSYGLFDAVVRGDRVEGSTLIDNLESQVRTLQDFGNLIGELSDRGISDVLLEDLQNAGPKSLEQLKGLNRLTDSELLRYQEIYRERSEEARRVATEALQPLQADTQAQIIALRDTANNELAQLNITWQQQINQVVRGTATQFSTLRQVGVNAGQSLLDGLTSVQGALLATARDIADSINKTLAETLNVDLPSTIRADFTTQARNNLSSNIANSSNRLNSALSNASSSINSSARASQRNTEFNQQTINNQNNFDMIPVIDAINRLATTPVQPQLVVDGRNLTQVVSQYQRQDAMIQGLSRGVQIT